MGPENSEPTDTDELTATEVEAGDETVVPEGPSIRGFLGNLEKAHGGKPRVGIASVDVSKENTVKPQPPESES